MKKILLSLFIAFLFCVNSCWAALIPPEKSAEYRAEMERLIEKSIPKARAEGQEILKDGKHYRDRIINNTLSSDKSEFFNLTLLQEHSVSIVLLPVYADLVRATAKYAPVNMGVLQTDFWGTPADYIEPYLKENNVNTSNLNSLIKYAGEINTLLEHYVTETEPLRKF